MPLTPEQRAALIQKIKSSGLQVQKAQLVKDIPEVKKAEKVEDPRFLTTLATNPEQGVKQAIEHPISSLVDLSMEPMRAVEKVGEVLDPYTGAPIRAGLGELQNSGGALKALKAWGKQQVAGEVLPTTKSGEQLTKDEVKILGGSPRLANAIGKAAGPLVGGLLDYTSLIGLAEGKTAANAGRRMAAPVTQIAKDIYSGVKGGVEKAGYKAADALFHLAQIPTQGNIKPYAAMRATKGLSGLEQMVPWAFTKGAGKELGALRGINATQAGQIPLEGSKEIIPKLKGILDKAADESKRGASETAWLRDKLEGAISQAKKTGGELKDLTVNQMDKLLDGIKDMQYTPHANEKGLDYKLKGAIVDARKAVSDQLAKNPQGQNLLDARNKYANLSETKRGRGRLMEALAWAGAPITAGKSLLVAPGTYHRAVGMSRIPKQFGEWAASSAANAFPGVTEAGLRSLILAPGRDDQTPEFDMNQVQVSPWDMSRRR